MVLFHITHRRNMASIDRLGLLPERATGRELAVWLVTKSCIIWALMHTALKKGRGPLPQLVVYEVELPRSKVRRFSRGLYRTFEMVRPVSVEPASTYTNAYPISPPKIPPDYPR
jgi:hypothetical protein